MLFEAAAASLSATFGLMFELKWWSYDAGLSLCASVAVCFATELTVILLLKRMIAVGNEWDAFAGEVDETPQ